MAVSSLACFLSHPATTKPRYVHTLRSLSFSYSVTVAFHSLRQIKFLLFQQRPRYEQEAEEEAKLLHKDGGAQKFAYVDIKKC